MPEPTIDEMLFWLAISFQEMPAKKQEEGALIWQAIRAILEQVRASEYLSGTIAEWLVEKRGIELQAIRAFVERVEKRVHSSSEINDWMAMRDELAAMEKESKEAAEQI